LSLQCIDFSASLSILNVVFFYFVIKMEDAVSWFCC